jgi:hypothetical protein
VDPIRNPYTPGAGTSPPELAGREKLLEQVRIAIARIQAGMSEKSALLLVCVAQEKLFSWTSLGLKQNRRVCAHFGLRLQENRSLPALLFASAHF